MSTYGSAPAALYLEEHLKQADNHALSRKVGRTLATQREVLHELTTANLKGWLSTRTLGRLLPLLSEKNHEYGKQLSELDKLSGNLVTNILEGEVKLWKNRVTSVRRQTPNLQRKAGSGVAPKIPAALPLTDEKTNVDLLSKSRAKLVRLNKLNSLYP